MVDFIGSIVLWTCGFTISEQMFHMPEKKNENPNEIIEYT